MTFMELKPQDVWTPHGVQPSPKLECLMASLRQRGWKGRHILVEEVCDYGTPRISRYFAWTGCRRVEAAMQIELPLVPCEVITHAEADAAFTAAGYFRNGYSSWRQALAGQNGPLDADKLAALEKAGLKAAAELMRLEIEANSAQAEK